MNLYLLSQSVNNDWDTYDSAIVVAESHEEAKKIHPRGNGEITGRETRAFDDWCSLDAVQVKMIGTASADLEKGVILASFNAG